MVGVTVVTTQTRPPPAPTPHPAKHPPHPHTPSSRKETHPRSFQAMSTPIQLASPSLKTGVGRLAVRRSELQNLGGQTLRNTRTSLARSFSCEGKTIGRSGTLQKEDAQDRYQGDASSKQHTFQTVARTDSFHPYLPSEVKKRLCNKLTVRLMARGDAYIPLIWGRSRSHAPERGASRRLFSQ